MKVGDILMPADDNLVGSQRREGFVEENRKGNNEFFVPNKVGLENPNMNRQGQSVTSPTLLERPVQMLVCGPKFNVQ